MDTETSKFKQSVLTPCFTSFLNWQCRR